MEQSSEQTPPLVAAPRHLRRRRLRNEIPDPLLVPGAEPFRSEPPAKTESLKKEARKTPSQASAGTEDSVAARRTAYQRKRLVALVAVIMVSLSIPALVAALLLAG